MTPGRCPLSIFCSRCTPPREVPRVCGSSMREPHKVSSYRPVDPRFDRKRASIENFVAMKFAALMLYYCLQRSCCVVIFIASKFQIELFSYKTCKNIFSELRAVDGRAACSHLTHKVFMRSFGKSQSPHKSVNLSFIIMKNELTESFRD